MASSAADVDVKGAAGYWFCGRHSLPVAKIHSELFTHLYAGFAVVDPNTGGVTVPSAYKEQFKTFTKTVQGRSRQVQTLLSIGGEGSGISSVVRDADKRAIFIKDSIALATEYNFAGLDLCWLYPSPSDDDTNLDSFLKDWLDAVKKEAQDRNSDRLLLTAAVFYDTEIPGTGGRSFKYPCRAISDYLDWINVLAIDFYTPSNSSGETGPVHAWHTRPKEPNRCGSAGIQNWINNGVATQKVFLGLPFYGYEWILDKSNKFGFFAPAHPANTISKAYRDIQKAVEDEEKHYTTVHDGDYIATYSYNDKRSWIGYDDKWSISKKVEVAVGNFNLGGYVAWDVGTDDEKWTLSTAAFEAWQSAKAKSVMAACEE